MSVNYNQDQDTAFFNRMNSAIGPMWLKQGQYYSGINVTSRGGIIQTRPGFSTLFSLPEGTLQGITSFKPTGSNECLVFAVNGSIYVSEHPFDTYKKIEGIQFNESSRFVEFADCLQSSAYNDDGELQVLESPRRILVIQDGRTRPAYWDGGTARHLNPTPSYRFDETGEILTLPGRDETPIGLHMSWANDRLWVARGPNLFASDIGNPLKFTEQAYLAEGRKFTMPYDIVGMAQPASGQPLIVFTQSTMTFIKAYVSRDTWLSDPEFQQTQHGVGCVAPRSIINKLGLIWWMSSAGWTNLNYAMQSFNDSSQQILDREMDLYKRDMNHDRTGICAATYEDYTLISCPAGDKHNSETWVYDSNAIAPGWDGIWTGIRPVEWSGINIDGNERLFCVSKDQDGVNRLWEAFQESRTDNGQPITCYLQTRRYRWENNLRKRFRYFDAMISEVSGNVHIASWVGQNAGGMAKILEHKLMSETRALDATDSFSDTSPFVDLTKQRRFLKSINLPIQGDGFCNLETDASFGVDTSFWLFIAWSGQMAIEAIRVFCDEPKDDYFEGREEQPETEYTYVNYQGFSGLGDVPSKMLDEHTSTQTYSVTVDGSDFSAEASVISLISQAHAEETALAQAKLKLSNVLYITSNNEYLFNDGDIVLFNDGATAVYSTTNNISS